MPVDDIEASFELFDDWEDKYRFVIELGRDLQPLDSSLRDDAHLVRGCQSQVWLHAEHSASDGCLYLALDSDAHIVRGLISIVLAAYQGKTPQAVLDYDIDALFDRLDLLKHLSPTRGNGLRAMITRVREVARSAAG
jgi:cysteine desulfuration protein SufE